MGKNEYIPVSKIEEKIDFLTKRIDYLKRELNKSYKELNTAGTETEIDVLNQYIYNIEEEKHVRYNERMALQQLIDENKEE